MIERYKKLIDIIVDHSLEVEESDKILITYETGVDNKFLKLLTTKILERNASIYCKYVDYELDALIKSKLNEDQINLNKSILEHEVNTYNKTIKICCKNNDFETKYTNTKLLNKQKSICQKLDDIMINKRKWVLFNFPSLTEAYKAKMTKTEFFKFSFDTMCIDYKKMYNLMLPLKKLMEKTNEVRIVAPNTDLSFSIKGIPAVICAGTYNIPDGEVYTAPVKRSINGKITFNTPSPYQNDIYNNICLEFKNGKIINATCKEDNNKINEILDTDDDSRYIGEFAIGLNPLIRNPIGDILFDEKIFGSIHLTPGMAYNDANNGNKSNIHWDLVQIQTKEYGGGEIYFDNVLIRKDGKFVISELKDLNFDEFN